MRASQFSSVASSRVGAADRGNAGVVHEQIEPAKRLAGEPGQPLAIRRLANVSLAHLGADCVTGGGSPLGAELGRLGGGGLVSGVVDHHVEPLRSQLKRDAAANSAAKPKDAPVMRAQVLLHLIHARQSLKK